MILRIGGKIHKQVAGEATRLPTLDHLLRGQNRDFQKEEGFGTSYTQSAKQIEHQITIVIKAEM